MPLYISASFWLLWKQTVFSCLVYQSTNNAIQGLSYSLGTSTVPALLALPTASTASRAYANLKATATRHIRLLTNVSIASLVAAYALSPSRFRHPYLLWTAVVAGLGRAGTTYAFGARENVRAMTAEERILRRGMMETDEEMGVKSVSSETGEISGSDEHDDDDVNGEEVRRAMETFRVAQGIRAGVSGVAFLMGVVGIWGDGY